MAIVPVSRWRGRIIVLLGIILVGLNLRVAVAVISPISDFLADDIGLTLTHESILATLPSLCFAFFGSVAPVFARRLGLEPTVVGAMLLAAIGEILRANAPTAELFLVFSGVVMIGIAFGNVLVPPLIKRYFPDKIGPVTSVYIVAMAISTGTPALAVLPLAELHGWRVAAGIWSVIGLVSLIPWLIVIFSSKRAGRRVAAIKKRLSLRSSGAKVPVQRLPVWKTKLGWGLVGMMGLNSLISYAMFAFLPTILRDAGYSDGQSAAYLAVFGMGGVLGGLLIPVIGPKIKRQAALITVLVSAHALGFLGLAFHPEHVALVWILITRIGDAIFPYSITLVNLRSRTALGSAALSGFMQGTGYLWAAAGPPVMAGLYALTGGWTVPLLFIVANTPLGLIGGIAATRSKPIEDLVAPQ